MSTRIMDTNFLDLDVVSNLTFSSEQAAFPVLNLFNAQRRSKVWRSNGFWDVTSLNNEIIFRETALTDLTATVAIAEYTSSTAFYAAIKAALEAAGASTYTVESDSTTLGVRITSDGAGGGGIFEIDWTTSSMADILGFLMTEEDTGALTYLADALKIHTDEWVQFDFGLSTQPTAFFAIGPRNSPIKISPSATIKLQGNETDVWTSSVNSEITVPYDDEVFALVNEEGLYNEALRYSRFQIIDDANPLGYVELGSLFLGTFFEPARGGVQFPFRGDYIDRSTTVFSEGGQTFSDIREKSEIFRTRWFGLTVADKERVDILFNQLGTSVPFFIQLDPDEVFSLRLQKYIRFVKFQSEPRYELVSPGVYGAEMVFREEL